MLLQIVSYPRLLSLACLIYYHTNRFIIWMYHNITHSTEYFKQWINIANTLFATYNPSLVSQLLYSFVYLLHKSNSSVIFTFAWIIIYICILGHLHPIFVYSSCRGEIKFSIAIQKHIITNQVTFCINVSTYSSILHYYTRVQYYR